MGHEDQFAPPGPNGRNPFGQATFTGTHGNERDAPEAVFYARDRVGPLTEPTTAAQPWRRELVFMPPSSLSTTSGICRIGGKRTLLNELRLCTWLQSE